MVRRYDSVTTAELSASPLGALELECPTEWFRIRAEAALEGPEFGHGSSLYLSVVAGLCQNLLVYL